MNAALSIPARNSHAMASGQTAGSSIAIRGFWKQTFPASLSWVMFGMAR